MATGGAIDRLQKSGGLAGDGGDVTLVGTGRDGLVAVASHPDVDLVLCASSGTEALEAVLAAIDHGKTIALANKEVLVMAGAIVTEAAARKGVAILPVDSEHNAIHQCLHGRRHVKSSLVLTARRPFRGHHVTTGSSFRRGRISIRHGGWAEDYDRLRDADEQGSRGDQARRPSMRAHQIEVVIHPQSVVHSMVELIDGSIIAQLGVTDMRLPIQYAFSYPERWPAAVPRLDLTRAGRLDFEVPDTDAFPCLRLAYRALEAERSLPVVLNAANEIAVAWFLEGRLGFTAISA
jgi:1-deoxy-D-xylulose-5-phosphate reductoisomerase